MKGFLRSALLILALFLALSVSVVHAGSEKYSIKTTTKAPPKELVPAIQGLLSDQVVQLEKDGKLVAEWWFCKAIPGNVAADKAKKNLTYRDLPETTLFGAVQFHSLGKDYRQQKIKAGVYTLRLGFQPQDGDHMGTAPHPEFLLLVEAKLDNKADTLQPKMLVERSSASINTSHPAVLLLFPNATPGEKTELASKGMGIWVLNLKRSVTTAGNKDTATLGVGLAVVGHAAE